MEARAGAAHTESLKLSGIKWCDRSGCTAVPGLRTTDPDVRPVISATALPLSAMA